LQQYHLYINKIERVKETDKDVRGSPQPWGYVHQKVLRGCNIYFISLLGYNLQQHVAFNFSKIPRSNQGMSTGYDLYPKYMNTYNRIRFS